MATDRTLIQPGVVAKIAGMAARRVPGVHGLVPASTGQAITNLMRSVTRSEHRDLGIGVAVGTREAAVDVRIVTDYGQSIPAVTRQLQQLIAADVQDLTGLTVKEVNVEVVDLYFAEDQTRPALSASRVR